MLLKFNTITEQNPGKLKTKYKIQILKSKG